MTGATATTAPDNIPLEDVLSFLLRIPGHGRYPYKYQHKQQPKLYLDRDRGCRLNPEKFTKKAGEKGNST